MTDPQTFITHITNLVNLNAITHTLHQTAYEGAQKEAEQPLWQAAGSLTSSELKQVWEFTHEGVTTAVREIQAQAWEEGFIQGAAYYYEGNSNPTDFTETAQTINPHKETN